MGRNTINSGTMTIDGKNIADVTEESLMKTLTYISHNSTFFKGTVRDNLLLAKPDAAETELWSVLDRCNLSAFLKAEKGLDLIIIDYLQLMQGRTCKGATDNRQQEISEISRSLKAVARELNVPVIALSQLSRSVESRQIKRPMLSDLRESGSLEQDADIVMFLYREDYYDPETVNKNITEVIVAKHRNGPVDTVKMFFKKEFTRFNDLSKMQ
jgi:replicative DNA helicase